MESFETENTLVTVKPWQFKPGNAGKPAGALNHLTKTVKQTLLEVFNELQLDPQTALKGFAEKYPREFHAMVAKLIPTEITGPNGEKFEVTLKLK